MFTRISSPGCRVRRWKSFAAGFDRLVALGPQEIQVGILKRLRGTPIGRHDKEWGMVYSPSAPYELLQDRLLDFGTMQRLGRFARYWDLIGTADALWPSSPNSGSGAASPFEEFMRFSDWFYVREGRRHGIGLPQLIEQVFILAHTRTRSAGGVHCGHAFRRRSALRARGASRGGEGASSGQRHRCHFRPAGGFGPYHRRQGAASS